MRGVRGLTSGWKFRLPEMDLSTRDHTSILCSGETILEGQFVLKRFLDVAAANMYFLKRQIKVIDSWFWMSRTQIVTAQIK
jgi:hypothetical protein